MSPKLDDGIESDFSNSGKRSELVGTGMRDFSDLSDQVVNNNDRENTTEIISRRSEASGGWTSVSASAAETVQPIFSASPPAPNFESFFARLLMPQQAFANEATSRTLEFSVNKESEVEQISSDTAVKEKNRSMGPESGAAMVFQKSYNVESSNQDGGTKWVDQHQGQTLAQPLTNQAFVSPDPAVVFKKNDEKSFSDENGDSDLEVVHLDDQSHLEDVPFPGKSVPEMKRPGTSSSGPKPDSEDFEEIIDVGLEVIEADVQPEVDQPEAPTEENVAAKLFVESSTSKMLTKSFQKKTSFETSAEKVESVNKTEEASLEASEAVLEPVTNQKDEEKAQRCPLVPSKLPGRTPTWARPYNFLQ